MVRDLIPQGEVISKSQSRECCHMGTVHIANALSQFLWIFSFAECLLWVFLSINLLCGAQHVSRAIEHSNELDARGCGRVTIYTVTLLPHCKIPSPTLRLLQHSRSRVCLLWRGSLIFITKHPALKTIDRFTCFPNL